MISSLWKRLSPHGKTCLTCVCLILLTVLLFRHTLGYPFLAFWDDASYVTDNPMIAPTPANCAYFLLHTKHSLYTPVTMWSFMADYAVSHDPFIFRVHNLAAHCIAAVFFFLILLKLGIRRAPAFVFALFWAIHPQKVESVCWISERKDVLCGMFAFASFYTFLTAMHRRTRHPYLLSFLAGVLCLLSIFSKPASLTFPGLFALWLIAGKFSKRKCLVALPTTVIGGIAALWSCVITASVNPPILTDDPTLPIHNVIRYFTSVFATDVCAIHPYRINPIFSSWYALPVLFLVIFCRWRSKIPRKKAALWGAAFLIVVFPVLGLHKSTFFEWCDRYNYLLSAVTLGFIAALCRGMHIRRFIPGSLGRFLPKTAILLLFGLYAMISASYSGNWDDETKLFRTSVSEKQRNGIPHLKAVEMLMVSAILRADADDLAAVNGCLERHADLYTRRFAEYLQIWEHIGGVTPDSITFAREFGKVHERLLRGEHIPVSAWNELASAYPDGVPVFCENFVVPALLNDLLRDRATGAFDLMLTKISVDAVAPELLELRAGIPADSAQ